MADDEIFGVLAASEQPDTANARMYAWPNEPHIGKVVCIEGSQRDNDSCAAWRQQGRTIPDRAT